MTYPTRTDSHRCPMTACQHVTVSMKNEGCVREQVCEVETEVLSQIIPCPLFIALPLKMGVHLESKGGMIASYARGRYPIVGENTGKMEPLSLHLNFDFFGGPRTRDMGWFETESKSWQYRFQYIP